jgi:predicted ribosomally synthesized peptide with SipW-like signal peptide
MLALFGLAITLFMVASLALFTDTENVGSNTFGTGTVDIAALPATAVFTPGPMAPGDQVTAEIDVSNSGSLALRYALTSTTTENALASTLRLTVKTGVATCDNANWTTGGTVIYPTNVLGATTVAPIFGDVTPGNQGGDRTLAPAATETLCLNVTLPITTTSASENLTTTATFNFEAEQTANNP